MKGWNHKITAIDEVVRVIKQTDPTFEWGRRFSPNCSTARCAGRPVYIARFDYVTGKAGRVTDRRLHLCLECGARWAKKAGLELPEVTP